MTNRFQITKTYVLLAHHEKDTSTTTQQTTN